MGLIDRWNRGRRARWSGIVALAALALIADAAWAIPQSQGAGTGGARARSVRASQCGDCAERASARRVREELLLRLDSLKWAIDHRRLSDAERVRVAQQLTTTLKALEEAESAERETRALMAFEAQAGRAPRIVVGQRVFARGYLGVTFDGLWARPPGAMEDNIIRFYEYPKIALVEASSPAERAGVLAGDTLVALNGDDLKEHEIAFGRLLVPNRRIVMRVRRDGSPRDLHVTVGVAPDYFERRATVAVRAPKAPAAPNVESVYGVVPEDGDAHAFIYWFGNNAMAGARLETVRGGLARALDVSEGVLVIRTVPNTPMYDAGLREGDVVTRVGGVKVRNVADLQRALTSGDSKERRLVIVREKKERQITLRW